MFWIFNFIFSFLASLFSVSYLMPLGSCILLVALSALVDGWFILYYLTALSSIRFTQAFRKFSVRST